MGLKRLRVLGLGFRNGPARSNAGFGDKGLGFSRLRVRAQRPHDKA